MGAWYARVTMSRARAFSKCLQAVCATRAPAGSKLSCCLEYTRSRVNGWRVPPRHPSHEIPDSNPADDGAAARGRGQRGATVERTALRLPGRGRAGTRLL